MTFINSTDRIFVAGHRGLVGSAIVRNLKQKGFNCILTRPRSELNLCDENAVKEFYNSEKPDVVFIAAAKVGGIHANNTYRAEFVFENLKIQNNLIWNAHKSGIKKVVFLGSSCIYPRECPQPMKEEHLLSGYLEKTNQPYAIAKIAGIELIDSINRQFGTEYLSVMPTNLYGVGDNFDANNSHVLPALVRRLHLAKAQNSPTVEIWGTGNPLREFMISDDCADAIVHLAQNTDVKKLYEDNEPSFINVGTGQETSIKELALTIKKVVGYEGELVFNTNKPDGTPRKLLDCRRLYTSNWKPTMDLEAGIEKTYQWFKENISLPELS